MTGRETGRTAGLESYLSRLEAALSELPAAEQREILLETRSHVLERAQRSPDRGVEGVLAELGPPEEYARRFLPEQAMPERHDGILRRLARLASGGWKMLPLLLLVLAAYALAGLALIIAVWKLLAPDAVGLWVSQTNGEYQAAFNIFATAADAPEGREVLGYSVVVIGFSLALAIHLLVSGLLRRLLRKGVAAT